MICYWDGPAGYTYCCHENQSYTFAQTVDVADDANGSFKYQTGKTGTINFNNATFGDPIPGVSKKGYYKVSSTPTMVDDNASGWTYSGWTLYSDGLAYQGTAHGNNVSGNYGQYTFTGTSVNVYAWKGPDGGSVAIYIDGVSQGTFSETNSGGNLYKQRIFSTTGLANGSHTVKVQAANTGWTMVDYITCQ